MGACCSGRSARAGLRSGEGDLVTRPRVVADDPPTLVRPSAGLPQGKIEAELPIPPLGDTKPAGSPVSHPTVPLAAADGSQTLQETLAARSTPLPAPSSTLASSVESTLGGLYTGTPSSQPLVRDRSASAAYVSFDDIPPPPHASLVHNQAISSPPLGEEMGVVEPIAAERLLKATPRIGFGSGFPPRVRPARLQRATLSSPSPTAATVSPASGRLVSKSIPSPEPVALPGTRSRRSVRPPVTIPIHATSAPLGVFDQGMAHSLLQSPSFCCDAARIAMGPLGAPSGRTSPDADLGLQPFPYPQSASIAVLSPLTSTSPRVLQPPRVTRSATLQPSVRLSSGGQSELGTLSLSRMESSRRTGARAAAVFASAESGSYPSCRGSAGELDGVEDRSGRRSTKLTPTDSGLVRVSGLIDLGMDATLAMAHTSSRRTDGAAGSGSHASSGTSALPGIPPALSNSSSRQPPEHRASAAGLCSSQVGSGVEADEGDGWHVYEPTPSATPPQSDGSGGEFCPQSGSGTRKSNPSLPSGRPPPAVPPPNSASEEAPLVVDAVDGAPPQRRSSGPDTLTQPTATPQRNVEPYLLSSRKQTAAEVAEGAPLPGIRLVESRFTNASNGPVVLTDSQLQEQAQLARNTSSATTYYVGNSSSGQGTQGTLASSNSGARPPALHPSCAPTVVPSAATALAQLSLQQTARSGTERSVTSPVDVGRSADLGGLPSAPTQVGDDAPTPAMDRVAEASFDAEGDMTRSGTGNGCDPAGDVRVSPESASEVMAEEGRRLSTDVVESAREGRRGAGVVEHLAPMDSFSPQEVVTEPVPPGPPFPCSGPAAACLRSPHLMLSVESPVVPSTGSLPGSEGLVATAGGAADAAVMQGSPLSAPAAGPAWREETVSSGSQSQRHVVCVPSTNRRATRRGGGAMVVLTFPRGEKAAPVSPSFPRTLAKQSTSSKGTSTSGSVLRSMPEMREGGEKGGAGSSGQMLRKRAVFLSAARTSSSGGSGPVPQTGALAASGVVGGAVAARPVSEPAVSCVFRGMMRHSTQSSSDSSGKQLGASVGSRSPPGRGTPTGPPTIPPKRHFARHAPTLPTGGDRGWRRQSHPDKDLGCSFVRHAGNSSFTARFGRSANASFGGASSGTRGHGARNGPSRARSGAPASELEGSGTPSPSVVQSEVGEWGYSGFTHASEGAEEEDHLTDTAPSRSDVSLSVWGGSPGSFDYMHQMTLSSPRILGPRPGRGTQAPSSSFGWAASEHVPSCPVTVPSSTTGGFLSHRQGGRCGGPSPVMRSHSLAPRGLSSSPSPPVVQAVQSAGSMAGCRRRPYLPHERCVSDAADADAADTDSSDPAVVCISSPGAPDLLLGPSSGSGGGKTHVKEERDSDERPEGPTTVESGVGDKTEPVGSDCGGEPHAPTLSGMTEGRSLDAVPSADATASSRRASNGSPTHVPAEAFVKGTPTTPEPGSEVTSARVAGTAYGSLFGSVRAESATYGTPSVANEASSGGASSVGLPPVGPHPQHSPSIIGLSHRPVMLPPGGANWDSSTSTFRDSLLNFGMDASALALARPSAGGSMLGCTVSASALTVASQASDSPFGRYAGHSMGSLTPRDSANPRAPRKISSQVGQELRKVLNRTSSSSGGSMQHSTVALVKVPRSTEPSAADVNNSSPIELPSVGRAVVRPLSEAGGGDPPVDVDAGGSSTE